MRLFSFIYLIIACFSYCLLAQKVSADQIITTRLGGSIRRSREPKFKIEFHPEESPYIPDDAQESVFMPDENGKNHLCFLPKVEKPKSGKPVSQYNTSSMIMESEKQMKVKTADELLSALDEAGCLLRLEGWWTYEFCYKKKLRQLHVEENKIIQEFVLGAYDPEATEAYNQNLSDVSILKDPHSKDASRRYHAHQYTNGTNCDLTNQPRETEARFVCSEGKPMISSITELATCKYALTVHSPMLCNHPLFREERPIWHTINCNVLPKDEKETVGEEDSQHDTEVTVTPGLEYRFEVADIDTDRSTA